MIISINRQTLSALPVWTAFFNAKTLLQRPQCFAVVCCVQRHICRHLVDALLLQHVKGPIHKLHLTAYLIRTQSSGIEYSS
jgi:hypothetical protein